VGGGGRSSRSFTTTESAAGFIRATWARKRSKTQVALVRLRHEHDVEHGAGYAPVPNIWTNVAVFNLNLWAHTLVEC
jgi:hypothetical protein